jgi:hypothetical protein
MSRTHGRSGYEGGCRCDICKDAKAAHSKVQLVKRIVNVPLADLKHGSYSTYQNYACRCVPCCAANTEYMRAYRLRKAEA